MSLGRILCLLVLFLTPALCAKPQNWSTLAGETYEAELVAFEWDTKTLKLVLAGSEEPQSMAARDLNLLSKLKLFATKTYREAFARHQEKITQTTDHQQSFDLLKKIGLIFAAVFTIAFVSASWFLAAAILRNGAFGRWIQAAFVFALVTALAIAGYYFADRELEIGLDPVIISVTAATHLLAYSLIVRGIYNSSLDRAITWYFSNWFAAGFLVLSLGGTGIAAQVYSNHQKIDWLTIDQYFTQAWLEPLGLL